MNFTKGFIEENRISVSFAFLDLLNKAPGRLFSLDPCEENLKNNIVPFLISHKILQAGFCLGHPSKIYLM